LKLEHFVQAQARTYEQAFAELRAGRKQSHWMWFIFPQIQGLGQSAMSRSYAIQSLREARDYLAHPLLGQRLRACFEATMEIGDKSAFQIFGSPDDLKFRSCLTLFAQAAPEDALFDSLLKKYFQEDRDEATLKILARQLSDGL
jgi:uncharacterized protein (DUF1810 family)